MVKVKIMNAGKLQNNHKSKIGIKNQYYSLQYKRRNLCFFLSMLNFMALLFLNDDRTLHIYWFLYVQLL